MEVEKWIRGSGVERSPHMRKVEGPSPSGSTDLDLGESISKLINES